MTAKAFLLTTGLLLIARNEPWLPETPEPPAPVPVLRLAPGILDEALLKGGEERAWLLDLAAGQYAGLVVDQQGIDVEVRLRAPDGRIVAAADSFNGILGPEPLPVVAGTGGRFRLEIRSITPGAPAGRYVLRLDVLRPATARDRVRAEAERWLAEGERLYHEDTPASLRASLGWAGEALTRFRDLGLPAREAEALLCLGKAHDRLGEGEKAAGLYRQALERFTELGDETGAGIALTNLGILARSNGQLEQALALYQRALSAQRRIHNRPEEAQILNNIGRAALELGETGVAMAAFEESIPLARSLGDKVIEARGLSNLGHLETYLGQTSRALDHLRQAATLLETLGDRRTLAVTLDRMAVVRALVGHPPEEVVAAFRRAIRLQREGGDRSGEAVTLHNLGWYLHRKGKLSQAERIFRETLAMFRAHGDRASEAGALINLGGIDLGLGRPAPAEESFTQALTLLAGSGGPVETATALFGLARARRAAGRTEEALQAIQDACSWIEVLRRKPADLALRLTFFASKEEIYSLRIDLLMEQHRRNPEAGHAARALLASEEARARTLLDLLDRTQAALPREQVPELRTIQRQVEKGTLLLEYHLGRERSHLWVVTPDVIESFELPPRELLEAEARRAALLLSASSRALARRQADLALADLSQRLLGPVAHRLSGAERLVIVPDGALWSISFAALPDPAPALTGEKPPLVVGHEIVILPSLSVLPRLREAAGRRPAAGTIAVVADPVFGPADPRVAADPSGSQEPGAETELARLPFSRIEADAILSEAAPRERFAAFDFAASRETVLSGRLSRYRIVHFATHAVLNAENPDLSGIVLSQVDSRGRPRNGTLRLEEIYRLHLPVDLVVLSACRTALGQEVPGEGLIGLTRGFFSAGARQVLVSLWPVEDRATAELMRRFYGEMLRHGRPAAAALRAAQTEMWRDERWQSSYYWAGFMLQGDWRIPSSKPFSSGMDLSANDPQPDLGG